MARGDFTQEEVSLLCADIAQRYLGDGIHAILDEEQNVAVLRALGAAYHAGVRRGRELMERNAPISRRSATRKA